MSAEKQRYSVALTWEEIDDLMASQRERIYRIESEIGAGKYGDDPAMVAEWDQSLAELRRQIHVLGDVRRVAHGQAPVLGGDSFEELLEVE